MLNRLSRIWKSLKVWRRVNVGPVALVFKFDRAVHVTTRHSIKRVNDLHPDQSGERSATESKVSGKVVEHRQCTGTALIVGVGPGFGYALARRLAREGFQVIMASRNASRLGPLVAEIRGAGGMVFAYGCDATAERSVLKLFALVQKVHGVPNLVVYSLQSFGPGDAIDIEVPAFEEGWKRNCLGSFLVSRSAARAMLPRAEGTITLVGSTSSKLGRAGHLNLAVGKFGQRAVAQVLARELWPKGIHVAHVIIDADIDEGNSEDDDGHPHSDPDDIAQVILEIHRQPKSAWTSEVDVRPWNERFWEHC